MNGRTELLSRVMLMRDKNLTPPLYGKEAYIVSYDKRNGRIATHVKQFVTFPAQRRVARY